MNMKTVLHINMLIIIFILSPVSIHGLRNAFPDENSIVRLEQGELVINAQKTSLHEILKQIRITCEIEITGLNNRENEPVTFFSRGMPEIVLKRLLRYLKEDNYAFEFSKIKLVKISVLPESENRSIASSRPMPVVEEVPQKQLVNAVKVQGIVAGTQAESLGLMEGDVIVEYDGTKIMHAQQLVSEVKKKSDMESVAMTVMRDGQFISFVLKGGLIGININTVRVPKEEAME